MQLKALLMTLALILPLSNCANYDFSRHVVQQGNLLPDSKINRLKIGMSKDDTAILMGTSMLSPSFKNDRWDYAYTIRKGNGITQMRHLTLYFVQARLVRIEQ